MEITLFKDLTTADYLAELHSESKKYEGLYVDMNNAPERKYVKEKADLINGIRKDLNRARIDLAKSYKANVESEFKFLDESLAKANEPFDLLINEHKAERAKILADEKAAAQLIIDADQKESDHEFALLLNKTYEFDQAEKARLKKEYEDRIASEAADRAVCDKIHADKQAAKKLIDEENARIANTEYVASVRKGILDVLMHHGVPEDQARLVIRLAIHNKLPQLTINY